MEITSNCDPRFPFNLDIADSYVVYQNSLNGPEFTFNVTGSYTCPRSFQDPYFPNDPRPAPPSGVSQTSKIKVALGEGDNLRHFGLNLAKLREVTQDVLISEIGELGGLHKAVLFYSPWELVGCPDFKNCSIYAKDVANVWKCVGKDYSNCYPIGDRTYGVNLTSLPPLSDDSIPPISAHYRGGAENWSVNIRFACNESLAPGELRFAPWADEGPWPITLSMWVATSETCREVSDWGNLAGGAVFLLIVFSAAVLYLAFGTLIIYGTSGAIAIPNEGFWLAVWDSLYTAVAFIFTCGRAAAKGPIYDRV
jgi:hypothetical protein